MSLLLFILLALFSCVGCNGQTRDVRTYGYKIEETLPHDASSYTQGLFFYKGQLYESAGQYGESSFRKSDLPTAKVTERVDFDRKYFVEGSCALDGKVYILTWREGVCFVYDIATFKKLGQIRYHGEGWGLTTDGKSLIMSDGSSRIVFRNPDTFIEERSIDVTLRGSKVKYINELEYVKGEIWANVYTTDMVLRIDPATGVVKSVINLTGLLPRNQYSYDTDVLNGIAYDDRTGNVYFTGKYWPKMFRISLIEKK